MKRWLSLDEDATLEDAFAIILDDNESDARTRYLALALLLDKCSGDGAIQQGGRGYFPRFCNSKASPTYDFSSETLNASIGYERLAKALHVEMPLTSAQLEELAADLHLSWTVKLQPGRFSEGDDSKGRIRDAIEHLKKLIACTSNSRMQEVIAEHPDAAADLDDMWKKVEQLPADTLIPKKRKASKDLTSATLAFQFFPSPLTANLLRLFVRKPTPLIDSSAENASPIDFTELGDDPIKLARGNRGYIFPAFTALPLWKPEASGLPKWKEFDIAAFKEALKALNQFNQKTSEREDALNKLNAEYRYSTQVDAKWKAVKSTGESEGESIHPFKLAGDERFDLVREMEAQLTAELNEGEWKISHGSLRGFRDLSEIWNQLHRKHHENLTADMLSDATKDYQSDDKNQRSIGSLPLFFTLCENRYWPLWLDADEATEIERENAHYPTNILRAVADLHNLERDLGRANEPIQLTPAEPTHSRRLYMFSDLTGRSKPRFLDQDRVEVSIAHRSSDGNAVTEKRARIQYAAPRLHRDTLLGGEESYWLQPMTVALGFEGVEPKHFPKFESAVALMPDFTRDGQMRNLLNFPIDVDPAPLHASIGNVQHWVNPFHGTREKHLHLHWPKTVTTSASKRNPWWTVPHFIENGFTLLSVDLGQRSAGAWALIRVSAFDPRKIGKVTKCPVHSIGNDGKNEWFAEITRTGMLRLPGEDQRVIDGKGKRGQEPYGKRGRMAKPEEYEQGLALASALLADEPTQWVGAHANEKSLPRQNDSLIALANRRLSRLATFHRWSCFDPDRDEVAGRREKMIANLGKEIAAWRDEEVRDYAELIANECFSEFRSRTGEQFNHLRAKLGDLLIQIANRTVPLRNRSWRWQARQESPTAPGGVYGDLLDDGSPPETAPFIRGQRGLSMARLEQLDRLRTLFLRYNRCFDREAGKPVAFGSTDRGRESGEPCQALLDKITQSKEQRINQTAHEIIAQALGVRLCPHKIDQSERRHCDIHGEYEKISGREPVDFFVIEDLNRYLTSQGRAPSENSRLMKWAHRAVRDKIKMLAEEPFGIPVVEVGAAYSSRFCARTGMPGARCEEVAALPPFLCSIFERKATVERGKQPSDEHQIFRTLLEQFDELANLNAERRSHGNTKAPRTLLLPKPGGPLFLGLDANGPGQLTQADTNAAANLGLRAVAAPTALNLLHRLRSERKESEFICMANNAREIAAYGSNKAIVIENGGNSAPSEKLQKADRPNFFFDRYRVAAFDRATVEIAGEQIPIAAGVGLWKTVNKRFPEAIVELNRRRLAKWRDDGDQLPM